MNWEELSIIFGLGLVSSLHCVQMCGPVVLSYSLSLSQRASNLQMLAHLSYNVGRIITYAALGAVAGLTGQSIGLVGRLAGMENVAALVAGGLMVVAGLLMLDWLPHTGFSRFDPLRHLSRLFKPIGRRIASPGIAGKFSLGLMMGFLPCGLIYAALFKAMATGGALAGAATMAAFGLGTAGALFVLGMFSSTVSLKLGRWGSRLAAVSVALLGVTLLWRGMMGHGMLPMSSAHGTEQTHCHTQ